MSDTPDFSREASSNPPPIPSPVPAPLAYETPVQYLAVEHAFRWEGSVLVTPLTADLPDVCIKCGQPGDVRHTRKLTYLNPLFLLSILLSWIVLIILFLVFRRQGTVSFSLCELHERLRRKWVLISWTVGLVGLAAVSGGLYGLITERRTPDWVPVLMIAGTVVATVGLILGILKAQPVKPKKIDRTAMWLKGITADFGRAATDSPLAPGA